MLPRYARPTWGAVPPKVDIPLPIDSLKEKNPVKQQPKQQNTLQLQNDQPPQSQQPGDAGEIMGDHVIGHALDAFMPGAGMVFEMVKIMGGDVGGNAPVPLIQREQQQEEPDLLAETETGEEDEEETE